MTDQREAAQLTQRDQLAAMVTPGTLVLLWAEQIGGEQNGARQYRNVRPAPEAYAALDFYATPANWAHNPDPRGGYGPRKAVDDGERARIALGVEKATGKGGWRD